MTIPDFLHEPASEAELALVAIAREDDDDWSSPIAICDRCGEPANLLDPVAVDFHRGETPAPELEDEVLVCDECGHLGELHLNGHVLMQATDVAFLTAAEFVFENATCWAENICNDCDPRLHEAADMMADGRIEEAIAFLEEAS